MTASVLQVSSWDEDNSVTLTVTAGSAIVVFAVAAGGASVTCSDSVNGSYGAAKSTVDDNNDNRFVSFVKENCGAGSTVITVTNAAGVVAVECGGVTSGAYDGQNGNVQTTPTTALDAVTSGTITPSAQPALLVGLSMHVAFFPFHAPVSGTGFTDNGQGWAFGGGGGTAFGAQLESLRVTSTSAVAATFSANDNSEHASLAILLLEDTGGPPPDPVPPITPVTAAVMTRF